MMEPKIHKIEGSKFFVGRLKPDDQTCCACIDQQMEESIVSDCNKCEHVKDKCIIVSVGTQLFKGDYAMVLVNGRIKKVGLNKVFDIDEVMV